MLDVLGSIGSIKGPTGVLEYGNVGHTDCVFLRYVGTDEASAYAIYTAEELTGLLGILRYAEKLSQTTQPGTILRLGALRAKPIIVRLALVHPNAGAPFILLRMLRDQRKIDIPIPIKNAIALFSKGECAAAEVPPVCGMLRRSESGTWLVSGQELHVVSGHSPGIGSYGEYLHPDEVRDGEEVVVWTFFAAGRLFVGTFQTLAQWQPPSQVEEPMAQEADVALFHGETYRARQIQKTFAQGLSQNGQPDPVWAAKIALSSLLCDILNGEDETGHATWIGQSEDPILRLGIGTLEQGQVSPHDIGVYQQISCYFHALGPDPGEATASVNQMMEALFTHVSETDPQQRRLVLGNWAVLLKEIHEGKPPPESGVAWKRCKANYPGRVVPGVLSFPAPSPWLKDWQDEPTDLIAPAESPEEEAQAEATVAVLNLTDPSVDTSASHLDQVSASDSDIGESPEVAAKAVNKSGGGKKPVALLVGLLVLGAVGYGAWSSRQPGPDIIAQTPTPMPSQTAQATPLPSATPVAVVASTSPEASGTPSLTPVASASATPSTSVRSGALSPIMATAEALTEDTTVAGLDPKNHHYVDRDNEGLRMLEQGEGWARYDKDDAQIFLGTTAKSARAKSYAGEALYAGGKKVMQAGMPLSDLSPAVLDRLKSLRISPIVDEATQTVLGFEWGEKFPKSTIALGQPMGANLMGAFEARDLAAFQQALTPETANLVYMDGETLFTKVAKELNNAEFCRAMIDAGAKVDGEDGSQAFWATLDPAVVAMLVKSGVKVDQTGENGQTKLFGAGPEMTEVLLDGGANPNFQDEAGTSALMLAKSARIAQALLKGGAKPNLTDKNGKTALMGADLETTKVLLAAKADPKLKDKDGRSALDYAQNDPAITALLRKPAK